MNTAAELVRMLRRDLAEAKEEQHAREAAYRIATERVNGLEASLKDALERAEIEGGLEEEERGEGGMFGG